MGHFQDGRYEEAAQAFLRADELVPSVDALRNALVSARRVDSPLLVARVATRILESRLSEAALEADAQRALDSAARQLGRLHLSCRPEPCALSIDGRPAKSGWSYVTPGSHQVRAASQDGAREERKLVSAEPARDIELSFDLTSPAPAAVEPVEPPEPVASPAPAPARKADPEPRAEPIRATPAEREEPVVLPKYVLSYVGVATTLGLAGATAWSGNDALRYRNSFSDGASQAEIDELDSKIRRTDVLLGASVVSALCTTAWFIWGTDLPIGSSTTKVNVALLPTKATLTATGDFL